MRSTKPCCNRLRMSVRDRKHVATCLGFGPRFLHSTGQDYKGGPNSGVFLQITCDDAQDLQVPGQKYTFGSGESGPGARRFSGAGRTRPPRAARHLGSDVKAGLKKLKARNQCKQSLDLCHDLQFRGKEQDMQLGMVGLGKHGREYDAAPDARRSRTSSSPI